MQTGADAAARQTISVAMIATNEEKNLPRTLRALRGWVDQIVVVDSGSTDRSPEIAREFGAEHYFNRDFQGHAEQKNIAIGRCTGDWVLLLDGDEVVTPELAAEIRQVIDASGTGAGPEAFWIPRLNIFLTRWMRHGGLYPDEKLRLWRRGLTRVDESIGPHGTAHANVHAGRLSHALQHYGYPDFTNYLDHMNEYSSGTVAALTRKLAERSSAYLLLQAIVNPLFGWLKNYLFRAGFLDGSEGLIFHLNHAVYVHWKYVKVWESRKRAGKVLSGEAPPPAM